MKTRICTKCEKDCSGHYAEFLGRPFHYGCLPTKEDRRQMAKDWVTETSYDYAADDMAFDAAREDRMFGRR